METRLLTFPCANSGKDGVGPKKNHWHRAWPTMTEEKCPVIKEASPSIKLGLGIGASVGVTSHLPKRAFTPAQLHELQQQTLIFNYVVSGLPVPLHLVLPIWKSVASSFGPSNGGIYNRYPSFLGFRYQRFDYRSTMDPEPGRCRRTDGKKWRCSRNVVPDQKYCERHMHRGRRRSRKHVEASENISESDTTTALKFDNLTSTINSNNASNTNANFSISIPENVQLKNRSSDAGSTFAATPTTTITTSISGNSGSNNCSGVKNDSSAATTTINTCNSKHESNNKFNVSEGIKTQTTISTHVSIVGGGDGSVAGFSHTNERNNIYRRINGNSVQGCSRSGFDYRSVLETDLHRCRRTDGKKWQCSRDAIPDEKYCGQHMHRGAKKLMVASEMVTVAAAAPSPSNTCSSPPLAIPKNGGHCINLNTDLSISISANSQQMTHVDENHSTSICSSDATTITDEYTSVSHLLALSP